MPIFPGPARLFVSVATVFVLSACAQMDMHRGGHEPATHAGHAGHGVNMGAPAAAPVALAARTVVDVTPQESAHVLGDMQNLLRSVGEINGALAARDWATVERIASSLRPEKTMGSQEPAAMSFHAKLPAGWSSFGAPMHQGFARIADEARGGQRVDEVLRTLSQTTRQCVGCHAQFQLRSALR